MTLSGYTTEINKCMKCGKEHLKGTYILDLESGRVYFGQTCAKKEAFGISDEKLKVAKSKENVQYNQLAFLEDSRRIVLNTELQSLPASNRTRQNKIFSQLKSIREEYKR